MDTKIDDKNIFKKLIAKTTKFSITQNSSQCTISFKTIGHQIAG